MKKEIRQIVIATIGDDVITPPRNPMMMHQAPTTKLLTHNQAQARYCELKANSDAELGDIVKRHPTIPALKRKVSVLVY